MPITIKRVSDDKTFTFPNANENTRVGDLKKEIKASLPPKYEHGKLL